MKTFIHDTHSTVEKGGPVETALGRKMFGTGKGTREEVTFTKRRGRNL